MSEVAKISVGIEAKIDALAADMKKAESVVKVGAKNIEKSVNNAATRMENSWGNAFAKMAVITQIAQVAERSLTAVVDVSRILGDETLNASQKIVGAMGAVERANIPVLSTFLRMGHAINELITGEQKLREERIRSQSVQKRKADQYHEDQKTLKESTSAAHEEIGLLQHQQQIAAAITNEQKTKIQQARDYEEFQKRINEHIDEQRLSNRNTQDELIAANKILEDEFLESQARQLDAAIQKDKDIAKAAEDRAAADKKRADDKAVADARLAQVAANKTKDIETQLLQAQLKSQGLSEEAQAAGIRRTYEKKMAFATDYEKKMLRQMMNLELGAIGGGGGDTGGSGGLSTLSTAIGGFTIGTGGGSRERKEQETQTGFLEQIAENTKDGGVGAGISPPR